MLVSEFSIKYKREYKGNPQLIHTSKDAASIARKCFNKNQLEWVESVIVIALNSANEVLGFYNAHQGGITKSIIDVRVVMQFALLSNAVGIIVAHNHPSGSLNPSFCDLESHQQLKKACDILGIYLLDNLIITKNDFRSLIE